MKNFEIKHVGSFDEFLASEAQGRAMFGKELGLTGSEISLTTLPADAFVPFVHAHKRNEEVYIIVRGEGTFFLDGEEIAVKEGDIIRVAPASERAMKAGKSNLTFFCIQSEVDSLTQATEEDGVILETKTSWMK